MTIEENRRSLELIIRYAFQQRLIPRRLEVNELVDDVNARVESIGMHVRLYECLRVRLESDLR
jgi:hypothetical protein